MYRFIKEKKGFSIFLIIFFIVTLLPLNIPINTTNSYALSKSDPEVDMKKVVEDLYNTRCSVFISGKLSDLKPLFNLSSKYGVWSLEHEVRRVKYLRDWAKKRDVRFINIESFVRIKRTSKKGDMLRFALEESYKFDYVYNKDQEPVVNSFGVGLRHALSLINKDGKWKIHSDWYTDCFEDAMGSYSGNITTEAALTSNLNYAFNETWLSGFQYGYNREKAVEYADKYCGAAWGSTNNFKYNKKYEDFNGRGGDCTNFISQVLGDKEGGGLRQSGSWSPGAHSWANVDGLKDHIIYSGKGYVIGIGTYAELTKERQGLPNGLISKLKKGDLICYVKKGDPDHFAIVTAKDTHDYPLVNSHTTDRYHVPWDLGWGNKNIKFILIHMNG